MFNAFSILGVPINNLDSKEFVKQTLQLIDNYRKEHPRGDFATVGGFPVQYVTLVNLSILANINGWNWKQSRNPETIYILRKADIVSPKGLPIVWLSNLLGRTFKEKVRVTDFILPLAKALGHEKKTVYLLGEEEESTAEAADLLERQNPGLQVVGFVCPPIYIQGEQLVEANQRDALILEEINKTSPDVLFISLEHPKQEIWFERVRHKLRIPLVIGINESFDILTQKTQKFKLFRMLGSFGRSIWNCITLLYLLIPLIVYHWMNQFITWLATKTGNGKVAKSLLFLSPKRSIAVIRLPVSFNSNNCKEISQNIEEAFAQDILILDAQNTNHIDIEGIALLVKAWQRAKEINKEFYGFGIKKRICTLFRLHKVWDIFSNDICLNPAELNNCLLHYTEPSQLYDSVYQNEETLVLSFLGRLDNTQKYEEYLTKFVGILERDCVIDFTYCSFIDNAGFSFLLQLKQIVEGNGKKLQITKVSKSLYKLFKLAKLHKVFKLNLD